MGKKKSKKAAVLRPDNMTIYEAMDLQATFLGTLEKYEKINVNLSDVSEIDSSGLQLMLALRQDAEQQDKLVIFTEPSDEVVSLLQLFDMEEHFKDAIVLSK